MDGARGNALEWALALLHAPGERHVLRQRPLPGGMHALLGIAAGTMSDALAEASRTLGEPEARLREAAQFYAREVLFHSRADAYRTLGVDRNASTEQIKAHHRLLQLWLHPDRLQGEDDAIFAARVNAAWNHLRSEERRNAYDAEYRLDDVPSEAFASDAAARGSGWATTDVAGNERWGYRLPVIALAVVCLALGGLVIRDGGDVKDAWAVEEQHAVAETEEAGFTLPQEVRREHVRQDEDRRGATSRKASLPPVVAPPTSTERATAILHQVVPARRDLPQARVPASASRGETRTGAADRLPPVSAIERQGGDAGHSQSESVPQVVHAAASAAATPPAAVRHAALPSTASPRAIAPPKTRVATVAAVENQAAATPLVPDFVRIQSARKAGEQLLRYMANATGPTPPIWNSPAIQSSADQLRIELHQAGKVKLAPPQWRIGSEAAALTSAVANESGTATGRITADLVWREGQWLVAGLGTERLR